ncbi:helix-turn-helix domain-containing protein [Pseudoxanthomonas sp.]|uniref:helix-turn-helix domain-containing protein n=1 Tax=Pseudoxanthomonas sp. TaxID=1871049 RepID=UPI003F7E378E
MSDVPQTFAARLKQLRMKKGESLQQAADAVGISKPHFWQLEQGEGGNPTRELLERLARHYQRTVSYLIGELPEKEGEIGALFRDLGELSDPQREQVMALIQVMKKTG